LPIRFQLASEALDRVAFAYSPLLEAALSLHVLVRPKHHPLQHAWVRAMRGLDPGLKRGIDAHSFLYGQILADCFLPADADRYLDFGEELERLRALDETTLAYELTRPLYDHGGTEPRDPHLDDPAVRTAVLERAALVGPDSARAAAAMIEDPRAAADRLAGLLEEYWDAAFGAEWERLEPLLAGAVADSGRVVAERGIYALLLDLPPVLRVDTSRQEFGLDVPHDHTVEIDAERTLVFVPSYYVWPHVRINCDAPWPLTLVYPAPFVQGAARRELPPAELVRVLRAAGDATRLQALRLIAASPRSTQELAPLIGISEAGLSKHLRVLAEAGLVRSRREGYYVLYSLVPERVHELAAAVPAFLEPPVTG
jgi:DNA-binding transcriptional ArsR family regulator